MNCYVNSGGGDCDNQARLMQRGCQILGVSAEQKNIYASRDADCLNLESRVNNGVTEYLILDFDSSSNQYNWNAFEGTCYVAGNYYSITPKLKASSSLGFLRELGNLGVTQYWVRTSGVPGSSNWSVIDVIGEVDIP